MKRLTLLTILLAVIAAIPLMAGGETEEPGSAAEKPSYLVFGTGGTSGTYYPIGGALKTVFEKSGLVESVTVESTGASVMNINNIDSGLNQVAIVMSDVAFDAVNGRGKFEDRPLDIRAIAGMYPNVVQIIAVASSGIRTVQDMEGKRVGVGKVGSGVEQSAGKVLAAAGLGYGDLGQVTNTGYADSVQSMQNGTLDAAFFTSGVPNSSIVNVMQSLEVVFVPVSGAIASRLLDSYPFYEKFTIPAGNAAQYNLDETVETVAIRNLLIVSPKLADGLVEDLTNRFYDYLGSDQVTIGALKQFDRDSMDGGLVVDLHPGAQAFYASR